jgi:hypothetical protein
MSQTLKEKISTLIDPDASEEAYEANYRLLDELMPINGRRSTELRQDNYRLVELDGVRYNKDVNVPAGGRCWAIFECAAVEGLHPTYEVRLEIEFDGDGVPNGYTLLATYDGQTIDLYKRTCTYGTLYYASLRDHILELNNALSIRCATKFAHRLLSNR